MRGVRCPKCRSFCDPEQIARCQLCGAPLPEAALRPERAAPKVHRETRRDLGSTRITFAVIGGLALLNFSLGLGVGGFRLHSPVVLLILVAVAALFVRRKKLPDVDGAGRVILNIFATIGIVVVGALCIGFGLLLLLFIACATGGLKLG
jgi:hypothetical protein